MAPFFGTFVSTAENIVVQDDVSVTTLTLLKHFSATDYVVYSFKLIMENVLVVLYQETKEIVLQHFLNILWNYGKGKRAICIYGKRISKSNYVPCRASTKGRILASVPVRRLLKPVFIRVRFVLRPVRSYILAIFWYFLGPKANQ